ncbi:hypothetical protein Cni_G25883 [Canna indica]|uniref:Uncharacterized protein n=1 Tax=Canna indica TaxID=4628 RepID=A0AAQ3KYK8_9LILI|nr:hypothetical protein Cni_G25883 [Canna indica]
MEVSAKGSQIPLLQIAKKVQYYGKTSLFSMSNIPANLTLSHLSQSGLSVVCCFHSPVQLRVHDGQEKAKCRSGNGRSGVMVTMHFSTTYKFRLEIVSIPNNLVWVLVFFFIVEDFQENDASTGQREISPIALALLLWEMVIQLQWHANIFEQS